MPIDSTTNHWTFLSNHAHVLISLHQNPNIMLREVATLVGITERAVQKIIKDLEEGGVVERKRDGRRNVYTLHSKVQLRHPVEKHRTVGNLLASLG
jgi:DNA-binding MarR family transcriptional regulator